MAFWTRQDMARWSTPRQLRKAGLFAPEGLILGAAHGRLLRHAGNEPVLLVASTGAGKTSCFVLPNLLSWRESVLVHDAKNEIHPLTAGWRSTFSRVVTLSPTVATSHCYNPLDAIALRTDQEVRDVQLVSDALVDPSGKGADRRGGTEEHFSAMASEGINGLLLYGLYTQRARSLGALNALLPTMDFARWLQALRQYPHPAIQRAAWAIDQAGERGERGGIITTLSRTLRLYTDPLIQRATDRSDFTLRDLRERARPMSLYLAIPPRDQERLRPWTRLVVRQVLDYAVSRLEGWRWRLQGIIDEFQSLDRIGTISDMVNYGRGFGVRLALVTPSMKALEGTFGDKHPFLEACKVQMVYDLQDAKVADVFSARVGMTEVTRTRQLGRQRVREKVKEPLLSSTALMGLKEHQALVIVGRHKVLARKTFYKDDPTWLERSLL